MEAQDGWNSGAQMMDPDIDSPLFREFWVLELETRMSRIEDAILDSWKFLSIKRKKVLVGDIVVMTEDQLLRIDGLGRKSINKLKDELGSRGLHLGMEIPDWPPPDVEILALRFVDFY